jgi:hypothetical protein
MQTEVKPSTIRTLAELEKEMAGAGSAPARLPNVWA